MSSYVRILKNGKKILSDAAIRDEEGKNIVDTYAKQDGYYEDLTAGLADNLKSTTGSLSDASITFRTAGGTADISDGWAEIKALYGNTTLNSGVFSNATFKNITTVGFNQWNGEYVHVLPSTDFNGYCISGTYASVIYYETLADLRAGINGVTVTVTERENSTGDTYDGFDILLEGYIKVTGAGSDTCVSFVWSGYRVADYESNWTKTVSFDTATYFPAGMKSVNNIRDEINNSYVINRIGTVIFDGTEEITVVESGEGQIVYKVSKNMSNYTQDAETNISGLDMSTLYITGTGELTNTIITNKINTLSTAKKALITKVVISNTFTAASAYLAAWAQNWSVLTNLNNNVWYGNTQFTFTSYTLSGTGALTSLIIATALNRISVDKRSLVEEIKYNGFDQGTIALSYNYSNFENLEHIWLDNARYEHNTISYYDYIKNDIHAKFDTGLTIDDNTVIEAEFATEYTNNNHFIFGTSEASNIRRGFYHYNSNIYSYYNSGVNYSARTPEFMNQKHAYKVQNKLTYIDNTIFGDFSSYASYTTSTNCILFFANGKMYSYSRRDSGALTQNFIPAYSKKDGCFGFFDTVSNTFKIADKAWITGGIATGESYISQTFDLPTYFYPFAQFLTLLGTHTEQEVAYFDFDGINQPDMSAYTNFGYEWYNNIDREGTSVTTLVTPGRYYLQLKPKNNELIIIGTGALSKNTLNNTIKLIEKYSNLVNKVIVNSGFTSYSNDAVDGINVKLPNATIFEFNQSVVNGIAMTGILASLSSAITVYINYVGYDSGRTGYLLNTNTSNCTWHIKDFTTISLWTTVNSYYNQKDLYLEGNILSMGNQSLQFYSGPQRLWFNTTTLPAIGTSWIIFTKAYVPNRLMASLLLDSTWVNTYLNNSKIVTFFDHISGVDDIPSFTGYTIQWFSDVDRNIPVTLVSSSSSGTYYGLITLG